MFWGTVGTLGLVSVFGCITVSAQCADKISLGDLKILVQESRQARRSTVTMEYNNIVVDQNLWAINPNVEEKVSPECVGRQDLHEIVPTLKNQDSSLSESESSS